MNVAIDNAPRAVTGRPNRVAWFVLLALATLQFAVAQHASAHALDDVAETCAYCVHLDDGAKALGSATPATPATIATTTGILPQGRIVAGRSVLAAEIRGPPSL